MATTLDRVCSIASLLADEEVESNRLGALTEKSWRAMLDNGLLRSLQPGRWGGGEIHVTEFLEQTHELSRVASSAGWVAGVIGVHPWQLALFGEEAQAEMWSEDPTRMHSSSYSPTGEAHAVPGGYIVSGRWSFSTGCDHCVGVNLGAMAGVQQIDGRDVPEFRSFILYRDQYRIDDTWHVTGMRGTGSKDIVVDDAFVPEHRTQSHLDYMFNRELPGRARNDSPLYRLPFSVVFSMALSASIHGCAQGFVETWTEQTRTRELGGRPACDDALTQRRLAEAVWTIDAARARMHVDATELWQMVVEGEAATMDQRGRCRWNLTRGCELIAESCAALFRAGSGRSVFIGHPLQQRYADLQAGLAHAALAPDPLARAVGGGLLGTSNPEMVL
jgi:3-hydroxy-9,10-secoandrosta-1,3,5(10)-triene-9,17-dione monooxygenase